MEGLPKLPGYNFVDPTVSKQKYFKIKKSIILCGYKIPRTKAPGIGGRELDVDSVAYFTSTDPVRYDPSLTYGRARSIALPQFLPHYALYDQKCISFKAFFKEAVTESPAEYYRVRIVNIIYFLEDDTMTVMEPKVRDSGLEQGRLVRRGKHIKNSSGDFWHWKDLSVGKDICINGIIYHLTDCDVFTREFMGSQGLVMGDVEEMPPDPYTQMRQLSVQMHESKTPATDDKLRRFLEYDGKVLNFDVVWDTRDVEFGELRHYKLLYFLADDTISIKEIFEKNSGRDPIALILRKRKIPKMWTDRPLTYPSLYLELTDAEVTEYYQPKDLLVGDTVYILGRRILLVDCDPFTRNYYRNAFCIEQKPPIEYKTKPTPLPTKPMPPHDGIGSLEDSLQNTKKFILTPPRKDVIRQLLNANKYLRYVMKIDAVHPEDEIRRFIMKYSLSEGTCYIYEPPIRNSGITGGKYLKDSLLIKPNSDPLNPEYYTPADFYIGAVVNVFQQRFIIIDADLYVYRYMEGNFDKFPSKVIENLRNHMFNQGFLTDDIKNRLEMEVQKQKKADRDAIGAKVIYPESEMDKCLKEMKAGGNIDPEYSKAKREEILKEYEKSLKHTYIIPEHGIDPVNLVCPYPVNVGDKPDITCHEEDMGPDSVAPKHVDTPEEVLQKHYASVYHKQHEVCEHGKPVECEEPEAAERISPVKKPTPEPFEAIMVTDVAQPKDACRAKSVRFIDDNTRCLTDKYDLCDLKKKKDTCGCTPYKRN
ncbi:hypothetical protein FQA39_LY13106 [Lamprigera yunnana]|nr:hypothetical protein FQA39_LY13106 [Lamprigera yunnana]